ncbi:MAG: hypothetical protein M3539_03625 [Acidobacteriota bacterium]|nr:hypothetical protein [Acidobacteriota bacterium]
MCDFKKGVEAGLNSTEDTNNWQAGNELGQELKDDDENKGAVSESPVDESSIPLFTSYSPGVDKESLQDEKDETEE